MFKTLRSKLVSITFGAINGAREYFGVPVGSTSNLEYKTYVAWRDNYFDMHKETLTEAKEKLGLAFCQQYKLRDIELSNCTNRIQAESMIFARYVSRYRDLNF